MYGGSVAAGQFNEKLVYSMQFNDMLRSNGSYFLCRLSLYGSNVASRWLKDVLVDRMQFNDVLISAVGYSL